MRGLLFPLWLISRIFYGRKKKVRDERKEKQRKHVRNFVPGRLKNVSHQQRTDKKLSEGQKEWRKRKNKKEKFSEKKANNSNV